LAGDAI